jgi:Patatin-like phospholipase
MTGAQARQQATSRPAFEIGLVMAGAISAGAYTAGVLDFLIEALDQWYAAHDGNPPHDVRLRVMSGASAGGMAGSILIAALGGREFAPVREPPAAGVPSTNALYRAWVQDIDIEHLLKSDDLAGKQLMSALDSTKLREIAERAVAVEPGPAPIFERRPYLADPFELVLSVANLRGVPYTLELKGGAETMTLHADHMHFAIGKEPTGQAIMLDTANYKTPEWQLLAKATLATGAFPFGLAPHTLERPSKYYAALEWPVSHFAQGAETKRYHKLTPGWAEPDEVYEFLCVDGGLLNNEPFEHAHRALRHRAGEPPRRSGKESDRAVILIAPFAGEPDDDYDPPDGFLSYTAAVLTSLMEQVRFKPEELILALDEDVYSRFLISPRRPERFKKGHRGRYTRGVRRLPARGFPRPRLPARTAQLPEVPEEPVHSALRRRQGRSTGQSAVPRLGRGLAGSIFPGAQGRFHLSSAHYPAGWNRRPILPAPGLAYLPGSQVETAYPADEQPYYGRQQRAHK